MSCSPSDEIVPRYGSLNVTPAIPGLKLSEDTCTISDVIRFGLDNYETGLARISELIAECRDTGITQEKLACILNQSATVLDGCVESVEKLRRAQEIRQGRTEAQMSEAVDLCCRLIERQEEKLHAEADFVEVMYGKLALTARLPQNLYEQAAQILLFEIEPGTIPSKEMFLRQDEKLGALEAKVSALKEKYDRAKSPDTSRKIDISIDLDVTDNELDIIKVEDIPARLEELEQEIDERYSSLSIPAEKFPKIFTEMRMSARLSPLVVSSYAHLVSELQDLIVSVIESDERALESGGAKVDLSLSSIAPGISLSTEKLCIDNVENILRPFCRMRAHLVHLSRNLPDAGSDINKQLKREIQQALAYSIIPERLSSKDSGISEDALLELLKQPYFLFDGSGQTRTFKSSNPIENLAGGISAARYSVAQILLNESNDSWLELASGEASCFTGQAGPFLHQLAKAIRGKDWERAVSPLENTIRSLATDSLERAGERAALILSLSALSSSPEHSRALRNRIPALSQLGDLLQKVSSSKVKDLLSGEVPRIRKALRSTLDNYFGYRKVVEQTRKSIKEFLNGSRNPESWRGTTPDQVFSSGIFYYGPPGAGKTFIVEAACCDYGLEMLRLSPTASSNKESNGNVESASLSLDQEKKNLSDAIREAKSLAKKGPVVLFADEFERIAQKRDEHATEDERELTDWLLEEMVIIRKFHPNIMICAATNHMEQIDEAALREGRIDTLIEIGTPTHEDAVEIVRGTLEEEDPEFRLMEGQLHELAESAIGLMALSITKAIRGPYRLSDLRTLRSEDRFAQLLESMEAKSLARRRSWKV